MAHTYHHDHKRHTVNGRHWPYSYANSPGRWVRQMMTKPHRRADHMLEVNLKGRGVLDEAADRVFWSHARKPHIYYW